MNRTIAAGFGPELKRLLRTGMAGVAGAISVACRNTNERGGAEPITTIGRPIGPNDPSRQGRLLARPATKPMPANTARQQRGLHKLGLGERRDGLLYVPAGYRPQRPAPLVVLLHGAGGNAKNGLAPLRQIGEAADRAGLILLAIDSRGRSWDIILGEYGPDVAFLDKALAQTFGRYAVDRRRLAIGGFSDGGSYALSLGITNGDLFTHVLAFSPGFLAPTAQRGKPDVFISHGTRDRVLPIDRCSRRIVPNLKRAGYGVRYREFEGGHRVPPQIAREAVEWFTRDSLSHWA
jgi:phospholipase/carboxylesterase